MLVINSSESEKRNRCNNLGFALCECAIFMYKGPEP